MEPSEPIILPRPPLVSPWRFVKPALRIVIYPWFLWSVISGLVDRVRIALRCFGPRARVAFGIIQILAFLVIGSPIFVLITGELLIHANELLIGEVQNYRVRDNGKVWWHTGKDLRLPGPHAEKPAPVSEADAEAHRRYLVELYSPVIVHKIGYRPEWDIPVRLDLDGNDNPRDNKANGHDTRPVDTTVYGEVTAETADSYYLLYCLYHLRDYDHPVREQLTNWSFHDSDNEGFMIRVDKKTMEVVQGEGWFHNRFFLANRGDESTGTEPVQGRLFFEDDTHPIIYAQSMGHGVRFAQPFDLAEIGINTKFMRFQGTRAASYPKVDRSVESDVTYKLLPFDLWYQFAKGPLGTKGKGAGMFEESITIGKDAKGKKLVVGRFIAGLDYAKLKWSRPKPPWSWDDGWDRVPIAVWHFFPARAFESHFGTPLSDNYLFNNPISQIFGEDPNALQKQLTVKSNRRAGPKWGGSLRVAVPRYSRHTYFRAANSLFKQYINYLFRYLG